MKPEIADLERALSRGKPLKNKPRDGRALIATFEIGQGELQRRATFVKSVPYISGFAGGLGGYSIEIERVEQPGYVTVHMDDSLETTLLGAATACQGWAFRPGSLSLVEARGFDKRDKAIVASALGALLAVCFRSPQSSSG
ncbi:hypothetical protein [Sorangium sp. So ce887]|uniref:hypothetical protein n=1 Tax=Sorangium sp. So ce887 TaxID=3133324 RepID=UPI003F610CBE